MHSTAITSTELHSMIGHGLVGLKANTVEIPKQPKPERTREQKLTYWQKYHKQYNKLHPERVKEWQERGRIKAKIKCEQFKAEGLTAKGEVRQRKPYKHWPELAGLERKEYRRRWMRLNNKREWSNWTI